MHQGDPGGREGGVAGHGLSGLYAKRIGGGTQAPLHLVIADLSGRHGPSIARRTT